MRIRSVAIQSALLAVLLMPAAGPRLQAAPDSGTPRRTWSGVGALVGGVAGASAFAVAFYHFTHRAGAVNHAGGTLGGTIVGMGLGAASGALLGAFVGALFPKH